LSKAVGRSGPPVASPKWFLFPPDGAGGTSLSITNTNKAIESASAVAGVFLTVERDDEDVEAGLHRSVHFRTDLHVPFPACRVDHYPRTVDKNPRTVERTHVPRHNRWADRPQAQPLLAPRRLGLVQ
jgi:hypothetical protein